VFKATSFFVGSRRLSNSGNKLRLLLCLKIVPVPTPSLLAKSAHNCGSVICGLWSWGLANDRCFDITTCSRTAKRQFNYVRFNVGTASSFSLAASGTLVSILPSKNCSILAALDRDSSFIYLRSFS